jgi:hypothetical protein
MAIDCAIIGDVGAINRDFGANLMENGAIITLY